MTWQETYERWMQFETLEGHLREELVAMSGNDTLLEDAFYKTLEFGTGGMRGEIGPGSNRMNLYTIRKAAKGFADFIAEAGDEAKRRGVVIAHDSRHFSPEFALEAARVFATNGIQTYLFPGLRSTPELSFAVRKLNAYGGVVITASHNPPEYNGFKVYGEDGGQLPPKEADDLVSYVNAVADELTITVETEANLRERGLLHTVDASVDAAYREALQTIRIHRDAQQLDEPLKIVYSPLHGTGRVPVMEGLKEYGFDDVTIVAEQAEPNGAFPTVSSPNPEEKAAFKLAMEYGDRLGADLLMATDPDADRVGLATRDANGEWFVLTGNQTGALLMEYILSQKQATGTLPENGFVAKTIVTSELGGVIGRAYGMHVENTLTGFKFIGEKIKQYEESGAHTFLFGYEESYGYLVGDFCRDKDAVQACLMAAEMAAYYKGQGKTLYDALQDVYAKYGYYEESLQSLTLKGKAGLEKIGRMMEAFRTSPPKEVAGYEVVRFEDYKQQRALDLLTGNEEDIVLPSSNVLKFLFEDGSWFCLRPSGTEPKIKFYFSVQAASASETTSKRQAIEHAVMARVQDVQ